MVGWSVWFRKINKQKSTIFLMIETTTSRGKRATSKYLDSKQKKTKKWKMLRHIFYFLLVGRIWFGRNVFILRTKYRKNKKITLLLQRCSAFWVWYGLFLQFKAFNNINTMKFERIVLYNSTENWPNKAVNWKSHVFIHCLWHITNFLGALSLYLLSPLLTISPSNDIPATIMH